MPLISASTPSLGFPLGIPRNAREKKKKILKKEENREKEKNQPPAVCDVAQPEEVIASLHMSHCSERRWRKCDVKGGKYTGAHCAQDKK